MREYRIYIGFLIVFAVLFLMFPKQGKFKYEYQKGRPWMYETLTAPIDIPILKSESELQAERAEKASSVLPYYILNAEISEKSISLFSDNLLSSGLDRRIMDNIVESMSAIYEAGVVPQISQDGEFKPDGMLLVQRGKRVTETPVSDLYDVNKALQYIKSEMYYGNFGVDADSLCTALGIGRYIVPNLSFDRNTTDLLHKNAVDYISPTKGMLYAGQLLVSEGEIVTADIEQLLDSYKAEFNMSYGYTGNRFFLYLSHFILAFVIVMLLYLEILAYNPFLFKQYRSIAFILLMPVVITAVTIFIGDISSSLLMLVPYTVFALYMSAFYRMKFVFPIYMISMLPVLFIAESGYELYIMNIAAGAVGMLSFYYLGKGWRQFLCAIFIFLTLVLIHVAFRFMEEGSFSALKMDNLLYCLGNAFFVVAAYPIVYLLEKLFGFLSNASLMDLADTNNDLLMELSQKAPGTFQHSLQVANLCEAAAREIDAESLLVRVGALYHDIGKMQNPQCFIENQPAGVNYHASLTPMESAQAIISHVEDGVAIAQKHKLPEVIVDFIRTHHGRSQTLYFYNKFCNEGGDPALIDKFTYNGQKPTKKEHVILMMADAVEAASRSLKEYSEASISEMVDRITDGKFSDSQLSEADISLKEINVVKDIFKKHLLQMYHARIAYPERKVSKIRKI